MTIELPAHLAIRRNLFSRAIDLLPNETIFLWKRDGSFRNDRRERGDGKPDMRRGVYQMFELAGIPQADCAIAFDPVERDLLLSIVYLNSTIAWKVTDDLFAFPKHGRILLQFDHDDLLVIRGVDKAQVHESWALLSDGMIPGPKCKKTHPAIMLPPSDGMI